MKKFVIIRKSEKYLVYAADDDGAPVGKPLGTFDNEEAAQGHIRKLRSGDDAESGEGVDKKAMEHSEYHQGTPEEVAAVDVLSVLDAEPESQPSDKAEDDRTIGRYPGKAALSLDAFSKSGGMFKDVGDDKHFFAVYSNAFRDKHKEIMMQKGADRYVARLKSGLVPYPIATHWHMVKWNEDGTLDRYGGAAYGEVKWLERIENFMVAIGEYYDNENGRVARNAFKRASPGQYTMSHGFLPIRKAAGGLIVDWNTFEISTLDAGFEANQYTSFAIVKEQLAMPITPDKKKSVLNMFGEARANAILADLETVANVSKALTDAGVEFKEKADLTSEEPADDGGADVAFKELFGDLVKDAGVLASGLAAETKERKSLEGRLRKIEKYLDEDPLPAGKGKPIDEEDEPEAAATAKKELADKQKTQDPNNQYENAFPGAFS